MGAYTVLKLKNKKHAAQVNKELALLGATQETYNGILYGTFRTSEMEKEDIRFCSEDEEGKEQVLRTTWKGEVNKRYFEQFGLIVGQYRLKISCVASEDFPALRALQMWLPNNMDKLDLPNCDNLDRLLSY